MFEQEGQWESSLILIVLLCHMSDSVKSAGFVSDGNSYQTVGSSSMWQDQFQTTIHFFHRTTLYQKNRPFFHRTTLYQQITFLKQTFFLLAIFFAHVVLSHFFCTSCFSHALARFPGLKPRGIFITIDVSCRALKFICCLDTPEQGPSIKAYAKK